MFEGRASIPVSVSGLCAALCMILCVQLYIRVQVSPSKPFSDHLRASWHWFDMLFPPSCISFSFILPLSVAFVIGLCFLLIFALVVNNNLPAFPLWRCRCGVVVFSFGLLDGRLQFS